MSFLITLVVSPKGLPNEKLVVSPKGLPDEKLVVSPLGLPDRTLVVSPKGLPNEKFVVSPLGLPDGPTLPQTKKLVVSPLGLHKKTMYEYRKLTPKQRAELVKQRLAQGFPPHSPPHPVKLQTFYLLTAACYEHQNHISNRDRRQQLLNLIFEKFINNGFDIRAWVILPNHYHLLVYVHKFQELSKLFNSIHGLTSRKWNLEERVQKRRIWYGFSDRAIRSDRHYYTTLNYLHYNPVKHGWVQSPYDWTESSVHWYVESYGRQWLRDSWVQYPVLDYGKGWDL